MLEQQRQFLDTLSGKLSEQPTTSCSAASKVSDEPGQSVTPTGATKPASTSSATTQPLSGTSTGTEMHHTQVQSLSLPIGVLLPLKLKEKIWKHEFVDMFDILYPSKAEAYNVQPEIDPVTVKNAGAWLNMSGVWHSKHLFYIQKHPGDIQGPLAYVSHVQAIMDEGPLNKGAGDWIFLWRSVPAGAWVYPLLMAHAEARPRP